MLTISVDGSIDIDGAVRGLSARSGDGRVRIHAAAAPSADGNLVTDDGSVLLEVPEGFGAELDATTGDGRVEVRDVPFSGDSDRSERGTAPGRLGSGGPNVSIRSGDGVITIRRSAGASYAPGPRLAQPQFRVWSPRTFIYQHPPGDLRVSS